MRIYLAGAYTRREEFFGYALELGRLGHVCTSSWLLTAPPEGVHDDGHTLAGAEPLLRALARQDRLDIRTCDTLIGFVEPLETWIRGTSEREIGFADGLGKGIVLVGPRRGLFDWMPGLARFETWAECVEFLRAMGEQETCLGGKE